MSEPTKGQQGTMTLPPVWPFLNNLFAIARLKYQTEHKAWTDLSFRLSGRFNLVAAAPSIQRQGDLDKLLRCLEDECFSEKVDSEVDMTLHYQMMFSEAWITGCYEILRACRQRDTEAAKAGVPTSGLSELDDFQTIFRDFELLRMPIAKFEIAKNHKIAEPLPMRPIGDGATKPIEFYNPKDPSRFHIMPSGVSKRGAIVWGVLDVLNAKEYWVERRDLADRLLNFGKQIKGAGELEAEQKTASKS